MTTVGDDGVYAGTASLVVGEQRHPVRIRLAGHLNPFDGHYHWQGTVHGAPPEVTAGRAVVLCIADRDATARLVERTAAGDLMI
ncbi:DUF4873 domain-containing protein, partial [Mycobacterium sp. ITM-2017-0098]